MFDKNLNENIILLIIITISLFISYNYYINKDHEYVKANNGKKYRVQITEDNEKTANLIAKAIEKVNMLLEHLKKSEPDDIRTKTLIDRFDPNNITENGINEMKNGVTSYTVNKCEKIVVCLKQKNGDLVELNTLMYVIIHELAHICDLTSEQHDEKFWKNFEWLLTEAINIGIYNYVDYSDEEEPYCGINITSNVIDDSQ